MAKGELGQFGAASTLRVVDTRVLWTIRADNQGARSVTLVVTTIRPKERNRLYRAVTERQIRSHHKNRGIT